MLEEKKELLEEKKERKLSGEQLIELLSHDLAVNLANCAVVEAQGDLEIRQGQLKQVTARAGTFRARLNQKFSIKPDEGIDITTGLIRDPKK